MASNTHKPGRAAANTFLAEEIAVVLQIARKLRMKQDVGVLMRSDAFRGVERKFQRMEASLQRQRQEAQEPVDG